MKRWVTGIFLLCLLTSCARGAAALPDYQPKPDDTAAETWAEKYPFEYKDWEASIHGQTYLGGDHNAPACTDCHLDPETGEMYTAAFRLDLPNRCGRCHDDQSKMGQYNIPTDVYDTYLADFHGTTISYYRNNAPHTWRYEAVCSDCHGSHAVFPADDTRSTVSAANLAGTCGKCHENATYSFTAAYGHYRPIRSPVSSSDSPLVFIVKLLYQAMIPIVLVSMMGYIALDVRHRVKHKSPAVAGRTRVETGNQNEES